MSKRGVDMLRGSMYWKVSRKVSSFLANCYSLYSQIVQCVSRFRNKRSTAQQSGSVGLLNSPLKSLDVEEEPNHSPKKSIEVDSRNQTLLRNYLTTFHLRTVGGFQNTYYFFWWRVFFTFQVISRDKQFGPVKIHINFKKMPFIFQKLVCGLRYWGK